VAAPQQVPRLARILVLLDMNGTLLYRAKSELPCGRKPDLDVSGVRYYLREGAKELAVWLDGHPRVSLAFYTSMQGKNARPAVQLLLGKERGAAVDVYDRPFNVPDPDGANAWDTMRDLPKLWAAPHGVARGHGPPSTVMIDDSHRKMRHCPNNVLVVDEYSEAAVLNGTERTADRTFPLSALARYLSVMLQHVTTDVRKATPEWESARRREAARQS